MSNQTRSKQSPETIGATSGAANSISENASMKQSRTRKPSTMTVKVGKDGVGREHGELVSRKEET